jgi:aspartyl aminopeptidase
VPAAGARRRPARITHTQTPQRDPHTATTTPQAAVTGGNGSSPAAAAAGAKVAAGDVTANHHALLLQLLADALGCSPADIVDFELNLCDVQPGVIGGAAQEFVFVGRLDNLASCYTALEVGGGRVCVFVCVCVCVGGGGSPRGTRCA